MNLSDGSRLELGVCAVERSGLLEGWLGAGRSRSGALWLRGSALARGSRGDDWRAESVGQESRIGSGSGRG